MSATGASRPESSAEEEIEKPLGVETSKWQSPVIHSFTVLVSSSVLNIKYTCVENHTVLLDSSLMMPSRPKCLIPIWSKNPTMRAGPKAKTHSREPTNQSLVCESTRGSIQSGPMWQTYRPRGSTADHMLVQNSE